MFMTMKMVRYKNLKKCYFSIRSSLRGYNIFKMFKTWKSNVLTIFKNEEITSFKQDKNVKNLV